MNPNAPAANAYPLPVLSYAAAVPGSMTRQVATDYAEFIRYGVGRGQTPGTGFGDLPPGYVPLPEDLRAQARAAAQEIVDNAGPPAAPPGTSAGVVAAPGAVPVPGGPAPGLTTGPSAPPSGSVPPPAPVTGSSVGGPVPAASRGTTPDSPLGTMRYVLAGTLLLGGLAGLAWPVLTHLGGRGRSGR